MRPRVCPSSTPGRCEDLSLCRRYHHSTRRSLVHAVSTGSHTVTAAGTKACMLSGNEMLRGTAPRMVPGALSQIQSSMVQGDTRFRFVWNELWHTHRTKRSTNSLMAWSLGLSAREWFEQQLLLPLKNQNVIVKWRTAMLELLRQTWRRRRRCQHWTHSYRAHESLPVFWLRSVLAAIGPPAARSPLIERLKDFRQFQGARYEILVAAVFTRGRLRD